MVTKVLDGQNFDQELGMETDSLSNPGWGENSFEYDEPNALIPTMPDYSRMVDAAVFLEAERFPSYNTLPEEYKSIAKEGHRKYLKWRIEHVEGENPQVDFYLKNIFSTIMTMAKSPEIANEISDAAIAVFEAITITQSSFQNQLTDQNLDLMLSSFFRDANYKKSLEEGRSEGEFKYFYTLRKTVKTQDKFKEENRLEAESRKYLVAAIASHQAYNAKNIYEDGKPEPDLEEKFMTPYHKIPLKNRPDAYKVFIKYMGQYHDDTALLYMESLPAVMDAYRKAGKKNKYSDWHFPIAESITYIIPKGCGGPKRGQAFPIIQPDKLLAEFRALEKREEYADELIDWAKWIIETSRDRTSDFVSFQEEEGKDKMTPSPHFLGKALENMEKRGFTESQIREVLSIREKRQSLPPYMRIGYLTHYTDFEDNSPIGVDPLFDYIETFREKAPSSMSILFNHSHCGYTPKKNLSTYLLVGQKIIETLGDMGAWHYFEPNVLTDIFIPHCDEHPEEFVKNWNRIVKVAEKMKGHDSENIRHFINYCVGKQANPLFPKVLESFNNYLDCVLKIADESKEPDLKLKEEALASAIEFFLWRLPDAVSLDYKRTVKEALADKSESKTKRLPPYDYIPPDVDYDAQERIFAYHAEKDGTLGFISQYQYLIKIGFDPNFAAALNIPDETTGKLSMTTLEGIPQVPNADRLLGVAQQISDVRRNMERSPLFTPAIPKRLLAVNDLAVAPSSLSLSTSFATTNGLHQMAAKLDSISSEAESLGINITRLIEEIHKKIRLSFVTDVMKIPHFANQMMLEPDPNSLLVKTNIYTQTALAASALLGAIGCIPLPEDFQLDGVEPKRIFDPRILLPGSEGFDPELISQALLNNKDDFAKTSALILRAFERRVLEERLAVPGLMPIGGKIHTDAPMNPEALKFVLDIFGLGQTHFRLIHRNDSLLLPPMLTAFELNMIIQMLGVFGIIRPIKNPLTGEFADADVQVGGACRLPESKARIIGPSMLLSAKVGGKFNEDAWETTHPSTMRCIMSYDEGVRDYELGNKKFPFDLNVNGRTDYLTIRDFNAVRTHQILHTGACHNQNSGDPNAFFAKEFDDYSRVFKQILSDGELSRVVNRSPWIGQNMRQNSDPSVHWEMVNGVVDKWDDAFERRQKGGLEALAATPVGQTIEAIGSLKEMMAKRRDQIMRDHPEQIEDLMNF